MTLNVEFTAPQDFVVAFGGTDDFTTDMGQTTVVHDTKSYTGDYTVTPKNYEETTLATKDLLMEQNVTVRKIPQYEVSNDSGGKTLIMGDEYFNG